MTDFDRLLGDSLKAVRDDHIRSIEAEVPAARARIGSRVRRRRFTFTAGGAALAAAAVAVGVLVVQLAPPRVDRAAPVRPAGNPVVVATIDVPGAVMMQPGLGALWVTHSDGIVGIDPERSVVETRSPVSPADDIAVDDEAVYVTDAFGHGVSRVPFGSDEAASAITVPGLPGSIAAGEDRVWYASQIKQNDSTILYEADAADLGYRSEFEFPGGVVADMTYADGAIWLSLGFYDGRYEVVRLSAGSDPDPRTFPLSKREGGPADIVVGEGAVWVLRHGTRNGGNTITRIDPETGEVNERAVTLPDVIESVAAGEGYLWATTAPLGMNMPKDAVSRLFRVDPRSLQISGDPLEVSHPGSKVAVGEGYVWVSDPNNRKIVQVDPYR
ncbi:MAG: hypothetical protein M3N53_02240 [Actinomycetota bacterium]|nr:hypothetical protein [Actinomycetota bacterium]